MGSEEWEGGHCGRVKVRVEHEREKAKKFWTERERKSEIKRG